MKREDLKALEISDENIEAIMKLHGQDVEDNKNKLAQAEKERDGLQGQLDEANKTIKGFEDLDVDAIKAASKNWEAKAQKAKEDADAEIAKIKFDSVLEKALGAAKIRSAKAFRPFLDMDVLKLSEDGESIIGLKEQVENIKSDADNDYLFKPDTPTPQIVGRSKQQTTPSGTNGGTLSEAIASKMFPKG